MAESDEMFRLEDQLRSSLPDEVHFLVDLVQAGMDAEDFRNSQAGQRLLGGLARDLRDALRVLVNPAESPDTTAAALRSLQVAHAALRTILAAIAQGRLAARNIDDV
jgi:hypothetical protein